MTLVVRRLLLANQRDRSAEKSVVKFIWMGKSRVRRTQVAEVSLCLDELLNNFFVLRVNFAAFNRRQQLIEHGPEYSILNRLDFGLTNHTSVLSVDELQDDSLLCLGDWRC